MRKYFSICILMIILIGVLPPLYAKTVVVEVFLPLPQGQDCLVVVESLRKQARIAAVSQMNGRRVREVTLTKDEIFATSYGQSWSEGMTGRFEILQGPTLYNQNTCTMKARVEIKDELEVKNWHQVKSDYGVNVEVVLSPEIIRLGPGVKQPISHSTTVSIKKTIHRQFESWLAQNDYAIQQRSKARWLLKLNPRILLHRKVLGKKEWVHAVVHYNFRLINARDGQVIWQESSNSLNPHGFFSSGWHPLSAYEEAILQALIRATTKGERSLHKSNETVVAPLVERLGAVLQNLTGRIGEPHPVLIRIESVSNVDYLERLTNHLNSFPGIQQPVGLKIRQQYNYSESKLIINSELPVSYLAALLNDLPELTLLRYNHHEIVLMKHHPEPQWNAD